jgi:hypothetical protein
MKIHIQCNHCIGSNVLLYLIRLWLPYFWFMYIHRCFVCKMFLAKVWKTFRNTGCLDFVWKTCFSFNLSFQNYFTSSHNDSTRDKISNTLQGCGPRYDLNIWLAKNPIPVTTIGWCFIYLLKVQFKSSYPTLLLEICDIGRHHTAEKLQMSSTLEITVTWWLKKTAIAW